MKKRRMIRLSGNARKMMDQTEMNSFYNQSDKINSLLMIEYERENYTEVFFFFLLYSDQMKK